MSKLYIKEVDSCEHCPVCCKCSDDWYCVPKDQFVTGARNQANCDTRNTIPDWCPLEDVKK